jgi:hypothetical protein
VKVHFHYFSNIKCSVADPDSGLGTFLTPGSEMGESHHPDPGSGTKNPDHIFLSLETIFLLFGGLTYINSLLRIWDPGWRQFGSRIRDGTKSDPGSGMEQSRIRDGTKSDPGSGINIMDRRSHKIVAIKVFLTIFA